MFRSLLRSVSHTLARACVHHVYIVCTCVHVRVHTQNCLTHVQPGMCNRAGVRMLI